MAFLFLQMEKENAGNLEREKERMAICSGWDFEGAWEAGVRDHSTLGNGNGMISQRRVLGRLLAQLIHLLSPPTDLLRTARLARPLS